MAISQSSEKKTIDQIRFTNVSKYIEILDPEKIGLLYSAILSNEFDYKLSSCNRIIINLSEFEKEQIILKGVDATDSITFFHAEASLSEFFFREDPWCYLTNFTARILAKIAHCEDADLKPIEIVQLRLLETKEDTPILLKSKSKIVKNYLIEPFLKIKGSFSLNTLLFVKMTNTKTKKSETKLIIESDFHTVCAVADSFSIKDDYLQLKSKTGFLTDLYIRRGFRIPINIPLVDFNLE